MKVGVIVNPVAGHGRALRALPHVLKLLDEAGIEHKEFITKFRGDATHIAYELSNRVDLLLIMGGDGTVNEVVQAAVRTEIPIVPLPLGTGNDYVKFVYGEEKDWHKVLMEFLRKRTVDVSMVDVGVVRSELGSRHFANGFGMGFDAYVSMRSKTLPFLKGDILYFVSVVLGLFEFEPPEMRVSLDGRLFRSGRFTVCSVGCAQFLGGGFWLFPEASLKDGLLDVDLVDKVNIITFLKKVWLTFKGEHLDEPEVHYAQGKSVRIESEMPVFFHLDGEVSEKAVDRVEIEIIPKSLPLVVLSQDVEAL